jgi:hypothetical protein
MESVRKDVECAFGVLKGRFRCLKLPIQLHDKETIDDMFFTCVGLHNMLHLWDGRGEWEKGMSWEGVDGDHEDEEDPHWKRPRVRRHDGVWELCHAERDDSRLGSFEFGVNALAVGEEHLSPLQLAMLYHENSAAFTALQQKLVANYRIRKEQGSVEWLRS